MTLNRFLTSAAAAAALSACPVAVLAQTAPPAPETSAPPTAAAPSTAAPALPSIPKIEGGADLYETAKASGQFTILVKALDATNLKGALKGNPNITLFAPTDAAFKALPPDQLAKLMSPDGLPALQKILLYHIVGAPVDSLKMKGAKGPVQTEEGQTLLIDGADPDDLKVNNADIIETDVKTANGGVLNAIDKVLVPPDSPYAAALGAAPPSTPPASPPAPAPTAPPSGA
ncbi:MAG TPA: fasciclin domain-containing protein [Caulobacteraceae bacterium]|nr:fasciclin domain-containing protein [Caulobacteraceae bacterium]